ncbi:hypothetical protein B4N89_35370 [Embleya scabrispora]|uniref:Cytochrome P450 n=1 Tax=Embleya scabrispora TaxID=159449 RepID=A0A1T3NRM8_9ACTN|nr:hypothetical protein [Embleya scabrispora]OPC79332.1 hypothetical protein B4N89_35370 [Embleya scabrispora]
MTWRNHSLLTDPAYTMPVVPAAPPAGVAWLRASVARFSDGAVHERRRALVVADLDRIDPHHLGERAARGGRGPVEVLAEALGLPGELAAGIAADVAVVATAYQPHTAITAEADRAVVRLVRVCGGVADEATANRIGLLVQACDATKALTAHLAAGRTDPPVPHTRRVAPNGTTIKIDLTESPFGLGPHACPAQTHAHSLASAPLKAPTPQPTRTNPT